MGVGHLPPAVLSVHKTMVDWVFPGDTCEVHCQSDQCWAVQPVSATIVFATALGFFVYLPRAIWKGATIAQCICIFGIGWFEFVHGLSHFYDTYIRHIDSYLHLSFYLIMFGLTWALSEKTGKMSFSRTGSIVAVTMVMIDAWLVATYSVTLYNIILVVAMFQLLINGYLDYIDEASRRLYHSLAACQLLLLVMFVNEAFHCDDMIAVTSPMVPPHAFFELGAAVFFFYFARFFMECKGATLKKTKLE